MDVDSFFADWVLANYLFDAQLGDGQFGYPSLNNYFRRQPSCLTLIHQLPFQFQSENKPYATEYYEVTLPMGGPPQPLELELRLQLENPYPQDAWLQWVEIRDGQVELQRFRVSEYRGRPMLATLHEGAEQRLHRLFTIHTGQPRKHRTHPLYTEYPSVGWSCLLVRYSKHIMYTRRCRLCHSTACGSLLPIWMKEERSTAINSSDSSRVPEPQTRPTHDLLIDAIRNYDEVRVEQLLSLGVDINRDFDGLTPGCPCSGASRLPHSRPPPRRRGAIQTSRRAIPYIMYAPEQQGQDCIRGPITKFTAARYFTQFQIKTST